MDTLTEADMQAIASMIDRSEKMQGKFAQGSSQHTLQKNRIKALYIASSLITREQNGDGAAICYTKEELENARAPIASLLSKSEKAQTKLAEGTWQHTMLGGNIRALRIATPLLIKALSEMRPGDEP